MDIHLEGKHITHTGPLLSNYYFLKASPFLSEVWDKRIANDY